MQECKDIKPRNSDGQPHGYWANGALYYKGNYINGNKDGYWERCNSDGTLNYKQYYARM